MNQNVKVLSGINIILGAWMIIAPFVLGYSNNPVALWNNIIIGAIVVSLGMDSCGKSSKHTRTKLDQCHPGCMADHRAVRSWNG